MCSTLQRTLNRCLFHCDSFEYRIACRNGPKEKVRILILMEAGNGPVWINRLKSAAKPASHSPKSGRERKIGRLATGGGCCIALLSLIAWFVLAGLAVSAFSEILAP